MFTVKAEVHKPNCAPSYQIYEAASVSVHKPNHGGVPPSINEPEYEVEILGADRDIVRVLPVGNSFMEHYQAVFIMNERGKTVDSVYPGPRSVAT